MGGLASRSVLGQCGGAQGGFGNQGPGAMAEAPEGEAAALSQRITFPEEGMVVLKAAWLGSFGDRKVANAQPREFFHGGRALQDAGIFSLWGSCIGVF